MILNIRGPNGSGKSTVVHQLLRSAPACDTLFERAPSRRRIPIGYIVQGVTRWPIMVVGSYEVTCGGCDSIKLLPLIFDTVREMNRFGHVVFEGIMVSNTRNPQYLEAMRSGIGGSLILGLCVPVDRCVENILRRRTNRGITAPFDSKHVRGLAPRILRLLDALEQEHGLTVVRLQREPEIGDVVRLIRDNEQHENYDGKFRALDEICAIYHRARGGPGAPCPRPATTVDTRPDSCQLPLL